MESELGSLYVDLRQFLIELWPLTCVRISFLLNILRMNGWYLTKFSICIDINEIIVGIVMRKISHTVKPCYIATNGKRELWRYDVFGDRLRSGFLSATC